MNNYFKIAPLALALLIGACAHPIVITPDMSKFDRADVRQSSISVGYFISEADRNKEVETPGGGGDKVKYKPYGQLEPAIQKILSNKFKRVYSMTNPEDRAFILEKRISYVFVPTIKTDSSSKSVLTWPPTNFTVELECRALNKSGTQVWQKRFVGKGEAKYGEFKGNLSLASQRASNDAFKKFSKALNKERLFR